ncbi:MAG: hypothetical protein RIE73_06965 [Coleofasciculus sp. C1-SOL-03]|jgi:hypothetical protein|uniref:hypothetical protein n=1 Tax=Coleofasciculus sp. C1-SOL-03 TaxID=3069522 RepID=UPI0032F7C14B
MSHEPYLAEFRLNKRYIGSIVAASDRQDGWGLYSLIIQMKFLLPPTLERLIQCIYDPSQPLGECLYEKGVLSLANLEFLFQLQLTREFYAVTDNSNTRFSIDTDITIPNFELTGLSLPLICLTGSDESLGGCTVTLKSNPFCFWSQGLIKNKVPNVSGDHNSGVVPPTLLIRHFPPECHLLKYREFYSHL